MMNRALLLWVLFVTLMTSLPVVTSAQGHEFEKTIRQLSGEDYRYGIDFLFFSRLAEGELRFSETDQPGVYRAELIGRTLGIASWLAGERTQTYASLMESMPDGSLRSIEHSGRVVKRKWGKWRKRERRHRYDYEQGKIFVEKFKEEKPHSSKVVAIPAGQHPVDMLTAFYNLRTGVYGPLVRGKKFLIPTYSGKGFIDIQVHVLTLEEQSAYSQFPANGLLLFVVLDPKMLDTNSGNLICWINSAGIPERGIVEDVIGMGDVIGFLEREDL